MNLILYTPQLSLKENNKILNLIWLHHKSRHLPH